MTHWTESSFRLVGKLRVRMFTYVETPLKFIFKQRSITKISAYSHLCSYFWIPSCFWAFICITILGIRVLKHYPFLVCFSICTSLSYFKACLPSGATDCCRCFGDLKGCHFRVTKYHEGFVIIKWASTNKIFFLNCLHFVRYYLF